MVAPRPPTEASHLFLKDLSSGGGRCGASPETQSHVKKTWIGAERPDHVRVPRRRTIRTHHQQNMSRPELAYPYTSAFPVCIRPHTKQGLHHNRDKVAAGPPTTLDLPARPLAQFADRRPGRVRPGSAPRSRWSSYFPFFSFTLRPVPASCDRSLAAGKSAGLSRRVRYRQKPRRRLAGKARRQRLLWLVPIGWRRAIILVLSYYRKLHRRRSTDSPVYDYSGVGKQPGRNHRPRRFGRKKFFLKWAFCSYKWRLGVN
jgi:hypothetical protein